MKEITVKVYEIAKDGLPPGDEDRSASEDLPGLSRKLINRVAFLWDGNIFNGWPLSRDGDRWEASDDCVSGAFSGVTHWVLFPKTLTDLEKK